MPENDARTMAGAEARIVMADRKRAVTDLITHGKTLREAADALQITFGQAKAAYRAVLRELQASYLKDSERHRARLVLANRSLQAELWRSYEKVRDQGTIARKTRLSKEGGQVGDVEVSQSTDPGAEARLLGAILKAQEQEAKLLGVFKGTEEQGGGDKAPGTVNVERGIIVMNNADLGPSEWVRSLPRDFAAQGKGIIEGETVKKAEEPKS